MVAKHMIYQSLYAGWNFFSRCLLWFALAADLPEEHPRVSPKVSAWDIIHQRWDHLKLKTSIKSDSLTPQEKKLILNNRTFDPLVSEKQLQGKVLPLIKDMLCNRWDCLLFLKKHWKGFLKGQSGWSSCGPFASRGATPWLSPSHPPSWRKS